MFITCEDDRIVTLKDATANTVATVATTTKWYENVHVIMRQLTDVVFIVTPSTASRSFTSSNAAQASTVTQRRRHRDPYAIAQAKARKAANLSRQEVLTKERAAALGDPVRGITTPYVLSFDTGIEPDSTATRKSQPSKGRKRGDDDQLNFYLSKSELDSNLSHSHWLTTPDSLPSPPAQAEEDPNSEVSSRVTENQDPAGIAAEHDSDSTNAREAINRIAALSLGSSKDVLRLNKRRCVDDFGRHNTDRRLPPRDSSSSSTPNAEPTKTPRVGPDTGSSEVQIAILTAKIRAVANFLETRGRMDKVNKRNLRLLVHRRQRLLRYLERKERGGARFRNVVEKLGLVDGMWKGEISM